MSAPRPFLTRFALSGFCLLALLAAGPTLAHNDTAEQPTSPVITLPADVGGPFTLTDPTGKQVTDKSLHGRWLLIFFGYTTCPDICPTQLQTMMSALARLPATQAEQIQPIFISIDPKRDTPEKLRDYAEMFGPRLLALRGTEAETAAVTKAYGVYAAPDDLSDKPSTDDDDDTYGINHTSYIYLIAPDGKLANALSPTVTVKQLAEQLGGLETQP